MKRKKLLLASLVVGLTGTAASLAGLQFPTGLQFLTGLQFPTAEAPSSPSPPGLDLSDWPKHCRQLRSHLQRQLPQSGVYQQRPVQPFVAPAWKLHWQGTVLAIPAVHYKELIVLRRDHGQLILGLQTRDDSLTAENGVKLVFSQISSPMAPAQQPAEVFQIAALEGVREEMVRGRRLNPGQGSLQRLLAQRLERQSVALATPQNIPQTIPQTIPRTIPQTITRDDVLELAYHHAAEDLSCDRTQWEEDLPIALALKVKLETEQARDPAVVAVYPQVGSRPGRVLRRRLSPRTEWQIQLPGQSQAALWISLPENHPSADVGLGTGQDNWWEAPQRPLWLDALEAAIATDSSTAWRQLALSLETAQFSENSARSVQQIITRLDAHPPDARSPNARSPAITDPKTADPKTADPKTADPKTAP